MYYRMLFLIPKGLAKNSLKARKIAQFIMSTDSLKKLTKLDFYDSFYLGGSWTGSLTIELLDQVKLKNFVKEVESRYEWSPQRVATSVFHINEADLKKREQSTKIFLRYFPDFTGEPPLFREEFTELGYEDDALLITSERQYYKLLSRYEGGWLSTNGPEIVNMLSLSQCPVSPENIIGKQWVVNLTCHR